MILVVLTLKATIFEDFGLTNEKGLSNYLSLQENEINQILQTTKFAGLSIISSGPIPPNPSELLQSERFPVLLEQLKKQFDFIVLDTPPVGLVADALELAPLMDLLFYVVRSGYTQKGHLGFINDRYQQGLNKDIYILINDFDPKGSGYGYGYGYGYGCCGYGCSWLRLRLRLRLWLLRRR